MTIKQLVENSSWVEFLNVGGSIVASTNPEYSELKQKYLAGDKSTRQWSLTYEKISTP